MTANLSRNTLTGKETVVPRDNVSQRAEQVAFKQALLWVAMHLSETARRVQDKSGNTNYADSLRELAYTLVAEGDRVAKERYPNFEPAPAAMKAGQSSGF